MLQHLVNIILNNLKEIHTWLYSVAYASQHNKDLSELYVNYILKCYVKEMTS
jgi:hypothetical protein